LGVIVIETGLEGGTMNTVKFCKDQERTLIVLKHPLELSGNPKMLGNDQLISKNQADLILETDDDISLILDKLNCTKDNISRYQTKKRSNPISPFQLRFDSAD
jgi:predicted Rossmann fold nucleotide-binding protein DprA/Smf involved in DNA uptake